MGGLDECLLFSYLIACVGWGVSPKTTVKTLWALFPINVQIANELLWIDSCGNMEFQLQTREFYKKY